MSASLDVDRLTDEQCGRIAPLPERLEGQARFHEQQPSLHGGDVLDGALGWLLAGLAERFGKISTVKERYYAMFDRPTRRHPYRGRFSQAALRGGAPIDAAFSRHLGFAGPAHFANLFFAWPFRFWLFWIRSLKQFNRRLYRRSGRP